MKTWILAGAIGIMGLGGAGNAFAAPKAAADTTTTTVITVTIDKNFGAAVTTSDQAKKCTTKYGEELKFPMFVNSGEYDDLLSQILLDAPNCGKNMETSTVNVVLAGETNYPFAVLPREYQWSGSGPTWIDYAVSRLGLPSSCNAAEGVQPVPKDGKNCTTLRNGIGFAFKLDAPFDNGKIDAVYAKGTIHIPVYPCQFEVSGPLPGIVAGASEQLVYLQLSDKTPNCRLPSKTASLNNGAGAKVALAQVENLGRQGQAIRLTDIRSDLVEGVQIFRLSSAGGLVAEVRAHVLPAIAVSKLVVKYNVRPDQDTYGHFAAASGDAATDDKGKPIAVVSPKLEGTTEDSVVNTAYLSWSSALASSSASATDRRDYDAFVKKIGETDAKIKEKEEILRDENEQIDDLARKLAAASSTKKGEEKPTDVASLKEQQEKHQKKIDETLAGLRDLRKTYRDLVVQERSYFLWQVQPDKSMRILHPETDGDHDSASDLHQIEFVVDSPISSAPTAILELTQTLKPEYQKESAPSRRVLKLSVPLAAKARVESLPLPARDLLEVVCNDEMVTFWNSEIHSIGETAITEGECRVQLKPAYLKSTAKNNSASWKKLQDEWQKLQKLLPLYGPQTFSVVVRRGGVEAKQLWQFSPTKSDQQNACQGEEPIKQPFWAQSITLGEPRTETKTDAYYTVEVRPTANQTVAVEYRNSKQLKIDQETLQAAGELTFETRLRSRGSFAIKPWSEGREDDGAYKKPKALRTYFSASVIASALRFHASDADRRSSTSSHYIQYVTPLVGALFSVEPWDYNRGHNAWALNPVAQIGGHFYKTSNGDVAFNPLIGAAITLPIIQEETPVGSQLGSKATLGLFLEMDMRDNVSFHGLFALSVNVGSLLSGK